MLCISAAGADIIVKNLPLFSTLDVNQFYNESITSVEIYPKSAVATYDLNIKTFQAIKTNLFVNTDIPSSLVTSRYQVRLVENNSECILKNEQRELLNDTLVDIVIDDQTVEIGKSRQFDDFLSEKDGYKYSVHKLNLLFHPFPDTIKSESEVSRCHGKVSVRLELML